MSGEISAIYKGEVVHKRLWPVRHELRYRVMPLLLDVAELDALTRRLRLFSYNGFNLFSIRDLDHGPGDGTPIAAHLESLAQANGAVITRWLMLCYPRVLGRVFNPLTVYFGAGAGGAIRLMVYEVNNTFGERATYVLPAPPVNGRTLFQSCAKRFYVSPFNDVSGHYSFHATVPGEDVTIGVALRTNDGPLLKTHFRGRRSPLTDGALLAAFARTPWMGLKAIAAIHFEAARLWLKGLRIRPRPRPPTESVTLIPAPIEAETRP